jgi:multisubunit Na+/H+ antiporter MnhF subunit
MLLLGVALIIVVNRLWAQTGLRSSRLAYALVQAINLSACVVLFVARLEGIDSTLDAAIRLFLLAFVAWHVALNYIANGRRAREREQQRSAALASGGGALPVDVVANAGAVLGDDGEDL